MKNHPSLTAIAAVAANGVIGDGVGLLWHYPEDFERFKQVTTGGVLVMGRRTFDSLGGPLPQRTSIVITRNPTWTSPEVCRDDKTTTILVARTLQEVGDYLGQFPNKQWWSIGGGEVYRLLWPYTTHLDITEIYDSHQGRVTFPDFNLDDWRETSRNPRGPFDFVTFERTRNRALEALGEWTSRAR
ncbi:MAG: dihydrofolate reductase [Propionibacteriaceae bacterium]|nr:dihydrofolate reductase [Propionibacteriaceae bacterium]